jgi:hypothetical protein
VKLLKRQFECRNAVKVYREPVFFLSNEMNQKMYREHVFNINFSILDTIFYRKALKLTKNLYQKLITPTG